MPYILTRPKPRVERMTFEDVLFDLIDESKLSRMNVVKPAIGTRTHFVSNVCKINVNVWDDIFEMERFYEHNKHLDIFYDAKCNYSKQLEIRNEVRKSLLRENQSVSDDDIDLKTKEIVESQGMKYIDLYYTFWIPKKSGGLRQVDAPVDSLSIAQTELRLMFEKFMNYNTYHTSAYAYIPKRSRVDLVKKLQQNKSRWILKLDFSNFFGSIDIDFTMRQLKKIFPFSQYMKFPRGEQAVYNCLKLCFLDGKLPQGTPFSPLITNILMIPLDYKISNTLYKKAKEITEFDKDTGENNYRLIYTRYADDIFIGSHRGFKYKPVLDYIRQVIEEEGAPFVIKPEKTRYSSNAGQNWILGLMYNQDYDITIGHKRKKQISAMISNFCNDYKNGTSWIPNDIQVILGNISYLQQIEPDYGKKMIEKYNIKFGFDVIETMKNCAY